MSSDRSVPFLSGLVVTVALACGCASSSIPAPAAAPITPTEASTTQLTSADTFMRAPRVGKSQLVADEDLGGGSVTDTDELTAPKEPRRATTHHRGGGFGVAK